MKLLTVVIDAVTHLPVRTDDGTISSYTYCGRRIVEDDKTSIKAVACPACVAVVQVPPVNASGPVVEETRDA